MRKVARKIKKQGWVQGKMRGPKGEVCLTQAVVEELAPHETFGDYYEALYNKLGMNPETWNDRVAKNQKQVLNMLYNFDN